jgi:hypothetical protein
VTLIKIRAKGVLGRHKVIRVASGGSVPHLGHLFDMAHAGGDDRGGDGDIENKIALEQLDLTNGPSLEQFFSCVRPPCVEAGALRGIH